MNHNVLHLNEARDPNQLHLQLVHNNQSRIAAVEAGQSTEEALQLSGDQTIDASLQLEAAKTLGITNNWNHLTAADEEGTTYLIGSPDKKASPASPIKLLVTQKPTTINEQPGVRTHKLEVFAGALPANVQELLDQQAADKKAMKAIAAETDKAEAEARRAADQELIEAVTANNPTEPEKHTLKAALGRFARNLVVQPPVRGAEPPRNPNVWEDRK